MTRIAVDARPLAHPGTGIYRNVLELLRRMVRLGGEWYLYSSRPYDTGLVEGPNVVHRYGGVGDQLTFQLSYPQWARRDRADVFWGSRHHLPLLLPGSVRRVLSIYDLVWREFPQSMRRSRYLSERLQMPRSARSAERVIVPTRYIERQVLAAFPSCEGRTHVVPCASFLDVLPSPGPGSPAGDYFLFVGTPEPRKNLYRLLSAYRRYSQGKESPLRLRIVGGEGWGGVYPDDLARDMGIAPLVEVIGRVSDGQLAEIYSGARALFMPSVYEGFGLPVVEALAQGVPVVVARDSAPAEVAGEAGYLVDSLSEDSICCAMNELETQGEIYQNLRGQARDRAGQFDWDQSAKNTFSLLREWG